MTANLRPYSDTCDSGIQWLGKLPVHWEVVPNRALFKEVRERNHPNATILSVTIEKGVIPQSSLLQERSGKDSSSRDRSAYKFVRSGDLAYNKMRAWQGAVGVSGHYGIVSPAYVVQRPRKGIGRYFHYLLRTPAFAQEAERWSYGITSDMWSLRPEHFKMIYSCMPPLSEQASIVRFLDHIDTDISSYMCARKDLIELLSELRHAIIHRTVTKGLDLGVELGLSGVEWLGSVPQHWRIERLKSLARNIVEYSNDRQPGDAFLGLEHVESWTGRRINVSCDTIFESQLKCFRSGDILFAKLRPYLAKVTMLRQGGVCVGEFLVLRCNRPNIDSSYMCWMLRSKPVIDEINRSTFGAKMPRTDWPFISRLAIVVPPPSEQAAIVSFLDRMITDIDATIDSVRRQVSLLREFRTRLVSDVVTGKLDVREAAKGMPT